MIYKRLIFMIMSSLPAFSFAGSEVNIQDKIKPNTITIIGESHKHPESITLFHSLISDHLKQNKCLTVGLEIASNQQTIINKIKQGRAVASDIEISSIIDHPPFRKMINDLVKLQKKTIA